MKRTLNDWLAWHENLHVQEIDLGLERVRQVYDQLFIKPPRWITVIVGGTNGKGSTLALLENIYSKSDYDVGLFTSPHISRYNERIRLNQCAVDDGTLCTAFAKIERARIKAGDVPLTYFEYSTLAALVIFNQKNVEVALLEVGLGGRLDAVNILDADCAVITNIALDHTEYLGDTRDEIAFEKAGIVRPHQAFVCAEPDPPTTLQAVFDAHQGGFIHVTQPYTGSVSLGGSHQKINAATAQAAVTLLQPKLAVSSQHISEALATAHLPGRLQYMRYHNKTLLLDVAHNPAGVAALAACLKSNQSYAAVFAAAKDKNIGEMIAKMAPLITHWYLPSLTAGRILSSEQMSAYFQPHSAYTLCANMTDALAQAADSTAEQVVIFGSFYTVAAAFDIINE